MVVVRRSRGDRPTSDFGGTKLSLLLEKQHNRGQDGAGAAILRARPVPGEIPYWIAKSASDTPLADVLGAIGKRDISCREATATSMDARRETGGVDGSSRVSSLASSSERIFLGHLRYATFGKNEVAFCHPFVHEASELEHTLLLAGNFNLTNAHELFEDYRRHGSFPTSRADGYLVCELIAHELVKEGLQASDFGLRSCSDVGSQKPEVENPPIATALSTALADADGAWTFCGATGDGWAFATRDPHGIRPGFYFLSDDVVAVASERPAIQAAFDVPPEAVKELPPGQALIISPSGEVSFHQFQNFKISKFQNSTIPQSHNPIIPESHNSPIPQSHNSTIPQSSPRPCSFERIYFSRANDAAIHRERKALGAALLPQILKSAEADLSDIFFSYIPNSARIAFHGLLEELFKSCVLTQSRRDTECAESDLNCGCAPDPQKPVNLVNPVQNDSAALRLCVKKFPRFGEVIVKDAKFRTFIADAAARREFYKHVYDVTYGLVRPGLDTLVVLDDSIVRGNTMKNAILPMLDRLGPKRIVIASSAPPIRYPDCYGIDMSTLGELVAFRALVNLLDGERELGNGERVLREALGERASRPFTLGQRASCPLDPLAPLYARFTDEQHCAEIARLLTPPGMKAEVKVVYQTVENLRKCLTSDIGLQTSVIGVSGKNPEVLSQKSEVATPRIGDWYFTGDYPTPGGYKVLHKALENYLAKNSGRSY